jgi:glycosyltransferase 2 family protein
MNKLVKLAIKLAISFMIIFLVLRKLELIKIKETLLGANPLLLLICLLFVGISLFLMVLKWKILIDKLQTKKLSELYATYWASDFMSLFGFGSVGSEIYKMISFNNKKKALVLSLVDKAYSFFWYILFFISIVIVYFSFKEFNYLHLILSIVLYYLLVFTYLIFEKRILKSKCLKKLKMFKKIKNSNGLPKKELIKHATISVLFKINTFILYSIILFSVGIKFNLMLFAFLSALTILTTLPISFQGLGVREFILLAYSNFMGYNGELIIAGSFLIFLLFLIFRIFGVIPFLMNKKDN